MENTANTLLSFEYNNLRGGSKSLKDHQGKSLCVIFWASFARSVCRQLLSEISGLVGRDAYKDKNIKFVFLAIHSNDRGDSQALETISSTTSNKVDCLNADGNVSDALTQAYNLTSLPRILIIAPDGTIVQTMIGGTSQQIAENLKKLPL